MQKRNFKRKRLTKIAAELTKLKLWLPRYPSKVHSLLKTRSSKILQECWLPTLPSLCWLQPLTHSKAVSMENTLENKSNKCFTEDTWPMSKSTLFSSPWTMKEMNKLPMKNGPTSIQLLSILSTRVVLLKMTRSQLLVLLPVWIKILTWTCWKLLPISIPWPSTWILQLIQEFSLSMIIFSSEELISHLLIVGTKAS